MRKTLMLLGLTIALALIAGCTSTTVTLNVVALKPVNEGKVGDATDGESRVVEIRIYQLKDDAKFKAATVEDVWTNAEGALGDSMIAVKLGESVFPEDANGQANGKQITIDPLDANTKFIGILALFSDSDDGERKVVVPLDQADDVLFELTGYWIKGTTVNDVFELQKAFGRDEDGRVGDEFARIAVVLANPRLVVAQVIQVFDEPHVPLHCQRRVLADTVERREEDAELHPAWSKSHDLLLPWAPWAAPTCSRA